MSRKLFSGPGPLARTFGVSRVLCIGLLAYDRSMLFAQPLFAMSRSLITDSVFDCLGISVRSVGIPISVATIASIP